VDNKKSIALAVSTFLLGVLSLGCGGGGNKDQGQHDSGADTGQDQDSAADADGDADADADADTDTDADADSDIDSDSDADSGADSGADADADTDAGDGSFDGGDADGDADADSDTDVDADADADGGTDWKLIEVSPSTTFTMGSPVGELGRVTNETQHSVTLTIDFEIMTHEVTQAEFEGLMGYNPSAFGPSDAGAYCGTDCPVERVSWHETLEYANRLSQQKGLAQCFDCTGTQPDYSCSLKAAYAKPQDCPGYRLPTESEWEYAIRAGSQTAFYPSPGNDGGITDVENDPNMDQIGWYYYNAGDAERPVMGKEANAWGLYDMSGNVWEWAWDWYGTYPGSVTDPSGAGTGTDRALRGGGFYGLAEHCRSAFRNIFGPGSRNGAIGFRLARSVP